MKIVDFCTRHHACADGHYWALAQGVDTMAELWERNIRPDWRIWIATRKGVLTPQQQVSWACRCVRRIWHLLKDERSRTAVDVAERWAIGEASDEELATARRKSRAAYSAADCSDVASRAAYNAPHAATADACAAAARSAANAAACAAACAAAGLDTERDWQAEELVRMFGNPFKKEQEK